MCVEIESRTQRAQGCVYRWAVLRTGAVSGRRRLRTRTGSSGIREIREKVRRCRWLEIGSGAENWAQKGEAEVSRARCGVCVGRVRVERWFGQDPGDFSASCHPVDSRHTGARALPRLQGWIASVRFGFSRFHSLFGLPWYCPTKRFPSARDASASFSTSLQVSPLDTSTAFPSPLVTSQYTTATMIIFKVRTGLHSLRSYPALPPLRGTNMSCRLRQRKIAFGSC
jgi:hypothetical protein